MKMNKEVVVFDAYEKTYRRGIVVEDGVFFTIEIQASIIQPCRRIYQYPKKDIERGEFIVYVKE